MLSLALIALSIIMVSCTKDPTTGSVSGTISMYDPESPLNRTPLEGITVFLVDTDFVVDSLDYSHNEAAVVNEAVTGSDGKYLIENLPFGNYAVVPVPDSVMYRFEIENDTDSVRFSVTENSFEHAFDFTAADRKDDDDNFQIRVTIINRLGGGSITISRPIFLFNIFPTFHAQNLNGSMNFEGDDLTLNLHYGVFGYLYVVSNNFMIKAFDQSGYYLFTRWISNDYFNTPEYAHWQIDWAAQTIKRQ